MKKITLSVHGESEASQTSFLCIEYKSRIVPLFKNSIILSENLASKYYTIIDFNEVDMRINLPEKVIIHRGR